MAVTSWRSLYWIFAGLSIACNGDLNNTNLTTAQDNTILRNRLNTAPGPSGLACAGSIPCP